MVGVRFGHLAEGRQDFAVGAFDPSPKFNTNILFNFAKIVNDHGFTFIGPKIEHIENMANKIKAKALAKQIGLPIIPGSEKNVESLKEAKKISEKSVYMQG